MRGLGTREMGEWSVGVERVCEGRRPEHRKLQVEFLMKPSLFISQKV